MKDSSIGFPTVPKTTTKLYQLLSYCLIKRRCPPSHLTKNHSEKKALKFSKVYSYISITMAHHMKLKFCTVVVHINTDILVEFHFDSCENWQDMTFTVTLLPSCPCTR